MRRVARAIEPGSRGAARRIDAAAQTASARTAGSASASSADDRPSLFGVPGQRFGDLASIGRRGAAFSELGEQPCRRRDPDMRPSPSMSASRTAAPESKRATRSRAPSLRGCATGRPRARDLSPCDLRSPLASAAQAACARYRAPPASESAIAACRRTLALSSSSAKRARASCPAGPNVPSASSAAIRSARLFDVTNGTAPRGRAANPFYRARARGALVLRSSSGDRAAPRPAAPPRARRAARGREEARPRARLVA